MRPVGGIRRAAKVVRHPQFGVCFNLCHALAMGDEEKIPALLEEAKAVLVETIRAVATIEGVRGVHLMGYRNDQVLAEAIEQSEIRRDANTRAA